MRTTPARRAAILGLSLIVALPIVTTGAVLAQDETDMVGGATVVAFDFEADAQGWEPLVADLPEGYDPVVGNLLSEWRALPENLAGHGLYHQGANQSDDLWLSWKGRVDGLEPMTEYQIDADLTLASSIPASWSGLADSPAEVYIKLGAIRHEPEVVVDSGGWLRLNARKGQGAEGGRDAVVLGDVANPNLGEEATDAQTFALMDLTSRDLGLTATTDEDGALWLFVGTDSEYAGFTVIYFDKLDVTLTPVDSEAAAG